ncbi:hypothetical protein CDIK_2711 [Cucumispora dikerogammari]|nr:hypothetical protein CDIK_2711 [Cucumispora dikerogammari]
MHSYEAIASVSEHNIIKPLILLMESVLNSNPNQPVNSRLLKKIGAKLLENINHNQDINENDLIIIYTILENIKLVLINDYYIEKNNNLIFKSFLDTSRSCKASITRDIYYDKIKYTHTQNTKMSNSDSSSSLSNSESKEKSINCSLLSKKTRVDKSQFAQLTATLCTK